DLFSLRTNRLLDSQRKADLKVALEKKAEDDILNYKIQKANEYATMALSSAAGLFGALATLSQAQTQNRLNDIDIQLARALEAAGLEEDTAIEKAEKELELANETGDAEVIQEKENVLKKAQIEAEYDKKRRKAEYEGAITVWEFQVAQTIASGILAVQNAIAAGWLFGGPLGAAAFGATALATSGIQLAAITEAKPQPPKLAGGGIIPGTSSGTTIVAGENNQAEGIFNQGQMQRLLDIADGNSGLTRVAPLSREVFYDELFQASQDGRLLIADAGVVKV
ncbi:MAG: hypothetical protein GY861_11865, partial [bacterium]|nr:hypothetical protein [bacterium]